MKSFTLHWVLSDGVQQHIELESGRQYRCGKSPESDIVITENTVSREHAVFYIQDDRLYVEDTQSTNGVWVDGSRIDALKATEVTNKAIQIGKVDVDIMPVLTHSKSENEQLYSAEATAQLDLDYVKSIHQKTLDYLDLHKRSVLHQMSDEQLRDEAYGAVREVLKQNEDSIPNGTDVEALVESTVAEAVGLGPLEPLINDESITEIMVNGPHQIYVEREGKLERLSLRFNSLTSLISIIERIVSPIGRRVDESSPMVDARLKDGSRVNAIIAPIALNGATLTIRKFPKYRFGMKDLLDRDTLNEPMAQFLEMAVKYRKNVIVSGGTGSGKTTTLNVLSNFIPPTERIVTIEDAAELQLNQDHVVSLESRPKNIEGKGEVIIRDLVKNALRMRPDRIVVGECRGAEALDMLQAMNTGHDGSLTTGHANSPRDLLSRLEVMVLMSGVDLPVRAIREQIASAADIVLQQTRFHDGTRKITSIFAIDGMEGDVILMQQLFRFVQTGVDENQKVQGYYEATGQVPKFYSELEEAGLKLDKSIFENHKAQSGVF